MSIEAIRSDWFSLLRTSSLTTSFKYSPSASFTMDAVLNSPFGILKLR